MPRKSTTDGELEKYDGELLTLSFREVCNRELKLAGRGNHTISMLMARLAANNGSNKPEAGTDESMDILVRIVRSRLRDTDLCFRYDSENILVVLPFTDKTGLESIKKKISGYLSTHSAARQMSTDCHLLFNGITYPDDGKNIDKLIDLLLTGIKK